MKYSSIIAGAIHQFLKDDDWKYSFDDETGIFKMGVSIDCKLGSTQLRVRVGETYFIVYASISISADTKSRPAVAEFITRANYGLRNGNFEMDFNDGELRYKCYVNCDGVLPSAEVIKASLYVPAAMIKQYGDGLLSVAFGVVSPEDAIQAIEGDN